MPQKEYDYLIVGSGLFGSVFAHLAKNAGKKCLIIDKRSHKGGNVFCENIEGINVHKYGPHIFHTNDLNIWNFVNSFVEFNNYTHSPIAIFGKKVYNLPFNMNTFYQLWGCEKPADAELIIQKQKLAYAGSSPSNLEEQAISLVGKDIYEILIKGYTEKQWGRNATDLPAFIIKRLPVRFTYDNNYFNDRYQGIPVGGYNKLVDGILNGIEVQLNTDYFENKNHFDSIAEKVVFTGAIDQYYGNRFGRLEYRSLAFETEVLQMPNFQGNTQVNYTAKEVPYTRIIEHKHFEFGKQDNTVISKEYSIEWKPGQEQYYPVNDEKNNRLFKQYSELSQQEPNIIFGGRLAEYKYYDMHQIIGSAFSKYKRLTETENIK